MVLPNLQIGESVESIVYWIDDYFGFLLDFFSNFVDILISGLRDALLFLPPLAFTVIAALLVYFLAKRKAALAIGTAVGFLVIDSMGLWGLAMETLALVLSSALIALAIGIPLGILAAKNEVIYHITKPVLDFMQTMPSFVYLIPAVIFFGLGNVPGLVATVVFAMPPTIRLTNLGIRQVPVELVEVSDAFGTTPMQKLMKVELPVAIPTIMAGVNQCIMLSLSMVVIAAMIGARGLGYQVLVGIQRVDIGQGFEAGLAIVIIAIVLDRLTQNLTPKK
ncbi:proline/glycine betaine ABC transporter permease [Methanolobus zinderi]|jgi:glycine betaine/proline transport system permease protein|uniref:Proline/glycine betaine ABC transporter permease n=1 Tax=Methanolobus zinderi TaxID=536044 RepID=A0A7D5J967_9EURY|nr:proline/glycine betaine ABC transporter permease [Methanolobus zinderi]QLC50190.1 proline/glycine betaine ABC transporter permease [Methanolobus zinderi]